MSSFNQFLSTNNDQQAKLVDCVSYLLNNELNSDVQFHFKNENTILYGHKLIIGVRSSVFNTMFYGHLTMAKENQNEFEIVDVTPSSFLEMLKFIYTDDAKISDNNFAEVMYAAHKYSINYLEKMCCDYVKQKLTTENCCSYLRQCLVYNNGLSKDCLDKIDKNINLIMSQNFWKDLSEDEIITILKRDSLDVNEIDLFEGVMKWAKYSCGTKGVEATTHNIRETFKIFEMVRFPTMTLEEFCKFHRANAQFLRADEVADIFSYINTGIVSDSLRYSIVKRQRQLQRILPKRPYKFQHVI